MKREIIAVFSMLVLTIFLSGCTTQEGVVSQAFIGGTEGLKINFLEGAPPATVYEGMDFGVNVMVENVGEYDIEGNGAVVEIVGIDTSEFGVNDAIFHITNPIDGRSFGPEHNVVPGTIEYADFETWGYDGDVSGDVTYPFRADVCYEYGTYAQAFLCIKEDLTDSDVITGDSVCVVTESKAIENSGAPVQIINLAESAAGNDRISFSFDISHRGSGLISDPNNGLVCSNEVMDRDVVQVSVDTGFNGGLDCTQLTDGTGTVKLYGGKMTIRCTQEIGSVTTDFEKLINIDLVYNYKQHVSTDVTVRSSG